MNPEKWKEVNDFRLGIESKSTLRITSSAMEERLYTPYEVLDHGFIRVMDYMGDDSSIVQAAKVSYGAGTVSKSADRALIRYLMRHRHTTPFEMAEVKFHVKLPIFVARQWIRHRTANVNEYSGRYSIMPNEYYIPEPSSLAEQSKGNKQGREQVLTQEQAREVIEILKDEAERDYTTYMTLLNDDGQGNELPHLEGKPQIARELARMGLGLNYYTEWYWKIDLHNLLHFLGLRMDAHAQWEIRQYADIIGNIVSKWCPYAHGAFIDFRYEAKSFSVYELDIIREMVRMIELSGSMADGALEAYFRTLPAWESMSTRERGDFLKAVGLIK